jgi:signal transduction histidine kinase
LDGVSTSVGFDATQLGTQVQAELSRELDQFEAARAEVLSGPLALSASQEIEGLDALDQAARSSIGRLEAIRARIARATDEDAQELLEMNEELLDLRAQVEENLEVLQLGQAVQLVSHEFESNIRGIRRGLQELAPWAKSTPRLAPTVRDLTASFTHLDAYLRLFTPLQRRLYRQATDFSGDDIFGFVNRVFSERLEREGVSLDATPNFRRTTLVGYPSTFYPAFLNLVDNAIHWAGSVGIADPRIELDAGDQWLSISDNGPGIRPRDAEAIFERGFSRRRGGRGLGLSLARDLLRSDGWILELDTNFDTGARFTLTRQSEGSDE